MKVTWAICLYSHMNIEKSWQYWRRGSLRKKLPFNMFPRCIKRNSQHYICAFVTLKEMQTDGYMEFGLRLIADLDILGTGRDKTVPIHPSPFIFDIHAAYESGCREKRRGAQRLGLLLKYDVPIPPATVRRGSSATWEIYR